MELESAVRRKLLADSTVTAYVGNRIYINRLEEPVAPAGHRALVIHRGPGWAETEHYEGAGGEFPTLILDAWSDNTRDADDEILRTDRLTNSRAVWRAAHRVLHNPRPGQIWGANGSNPGLLIVTSTLWIHPTDLEGNGQRTGTPLGEAGITTATYALHIATLVA
jgi:hypothetical protein